MKIHLLHGIHTPTGDPVVKSLISYLQKVVPSVMFPDYGWIAALETRRINPVVVGTLLPFVEPGDILVGHSNGCAIIYDMLQQGAQPSGVVLIDGALKSNFVLPACVKFAHVYWNAGDDVTIVAELAEKMPLSLVDKNWGDLGHEGYKGSDARVTINEDCGKAAGEPSVDGHSTIFTYPGWETVIAQNIHKEVTK